MFEVIILFVIKYILNNIKQQLDFITILGEEVSKLQKKIKTALLNSSNLLSTPVQDEDGGQTTTLDLQTEEQDDIEQSKHFIYSAIMNSPLDQTRNNLR